MDDDDVIVEMPLQRCLYRQSSLETRLTPEVPPEEPDGDGEDAETSDEEIKGITAPRVVHTVLKTPQEQLVAGIGRKVDREDVRSKLEDVIRRHPERKVSPRTEKTQSDMLHDEMQMTLATQQHKKTATPRTSLVEHRQSLGKIVPNEARSCSPRPVPQCPAKQAEEDDVMRVIPTEKDIKKFDSKNKMATLRPKSPRPAVPKAEKEESIWDKLGTLGRKKRIKEVQEVQAEGKYAIDSPSNPVLASVPPEEYELDENEERSMVEPGALEDPKVQELIQILIEWINDELASQRIIVQDLAEDLYDGQVLQKLFEKLTNYKMDVPEVTQSEEGQKQKLAIVLDQCNRVLGVSRSSPYKWGVEAIHTKNIVAILYLLVALARHFRAPIRLPEHVSIKTVVVQKTGGQLSHRLVHENITSAYDDVGMRCERDAFDTLFDHAPDKLQVVKKSMVTFVNKHLNKINLEVTELETQFHDGVYLTLLMGLLEGFFVPLYCFHLTPKDFDQKVHNVAFAFDLMEEVGISKLKARPEDIVNMDLKSTLRVLYQLFSKYKDIL